MKNTSSVKGVKGAFREMRLYAGKNPSYDWYIILACLAVFSVSLLLISAYAYRSLAQYRPMTEGRASSTPHLNQDELTKTTEDIRRNDVTAATIPAALLADPSKR